MKNIFAAAILIATTILPSCGFLPNSLLNPSDREIMTADIGPKPSDKAIISTIDRLLDRTLFDSVSKRIEYGNAQRGFYRTNAYASNHFAWLVPCEINAKNRFGAYTGFQQWLFFFQGNKFIGLRDGSGRFR